MAERAEAAGSLALSRRPRGGARPLARTVAESRPFGPNGLPRSPAQPAEVAQARVFERLLLAECTELQELAHRVVGDELSEVDRPSGELSQIRSRLDEIDALLRALQGRFPHSAPDGDH